LVCIHPSHGRGATSFVPLRVGRMILDHATVRARALPRGPRSGPGSSVPVHQHLLDPIRATGRHVPTSRLCGYTKRLGCAGAPKPPASGSELSLPNPSRHVAVLDSGEISGCIHPVPSPPMLSSPSLKRFDPPDIPANLFPAGQ
jgi:hypothetical protein